MSAPASNDALERFSPATRAWFSSNFAAPTPAQAGAWDAITSGDHTLVVAPTGSGKTLAAFLAAIDRLATEPAPDPMRRCRVLYVSPLKALAVDVEKNLRAPLVGIGHAATRLGLPPPEVSVGVRSGDTPADQRRRFAKQPDDILITTPESLYLLLTSQAREALRGVETVILDEVHAVAGTKRGAHLALSLERLDALLDAPAQRVGLSATVRPLDEVARFLAGGRPVTTVAPPAEKAWDLAVQVPIADMASLDAVDADADPSAGGARRRPSIWPHVEERIVDLIEAHRSTLVFANSRRLAETLTTRLNEIAAERATGADPRESADGMAPPPHSTGYGTTSYAAPAPAEIARAHHGSVSHEQRAETEEALKAGRLPAVVATSSLELGIDMGAVDLVVQVEAPPSVASGLQRVGRAGHQVGATSEGVFFPKFRGDLVASSVIVERMRAGAIEALTVPANPLDVLAQQIVAMVALDDWSVYDLEATLRRAAPFATLTRGVLEAVLDMLAGRYPSEEFAELRPRLVWDRVAGTLTGRRGAQRIAVTSGGTIPDRGLFGVFIAGDGPGRRVGELDEEMVYESRVGDVITLGTSTWLIEDITHDQVLVSPAPGQAARLPFWKGDTLGRPAELGAAVGAFVREVGGLEADAARPRLAASGLDAWAADNLLAYLAEQREATGTLPSDRTIVVERFTDELGDWRIVVHSPYGAKVHAPWALAIGARMRERFGVDVSAMHADDGIVLRLPYLGDADADTSSGGGLPADLLEQILLDPEDVRALVTEQVGGSALFAARFRECAGRALLLPNRRPGKRQALWQQRQRSAQLLEVASQYPGFPIVLEAVRECLQDVFDLPGLVDLMGQVRSRAVQVVEVTTPTPSPFASSLLFGYVAQYLYEGDSPLAERRAAALSLDPDLLAELLGTAEGLSLRDLLDPDALTRTESELQHLVEGRRARDADELHDLLRVLGPLSEAELAARSASPADVPAWLAALAEARRVIPASPASAAAGSRDASVPEVPAHAVPDLDAAWTLAVAPGSGAHDAPTRENADPPSRPTAEAPPSPERRWAAAEDAGRLRDALGLALPPGLPVAFTDPVPDPLGDLLVRYARTHAPFTTDDVAARFGLGRFVVESGYQRLAQDGRVVQGDFVPPGWRHPDGTAAFTDGREWVDPGVLRIIRRRSVAALRAEVEPVPAEDFARFLPAWQGVGGAYRGIDGVLRAVEQLAGVPLPASAVETLVLPARVRDYAPAMLDELCASGEVAWRGQGSLAASDGWVTLWPADLGVLGGPIAEPEGDLEHALLAALRDGGASFFPPLADAVGDPGGIAAANALWSLVWKGLLTNDTLAPLRARLGGGTLTHRRRPAPPRTRYGRPRLPRTPRTDAPRAVGGRWSLFPDADAQAPEERLVLASELLLDRYGVATRGSVQAEGIEGGFAGVYKVFSAAEDAGRLRRGYFVEGLGAAQFATTGAIDRLRATGRPPALGATPEPPRALVLAAGDPANPFGAALPWPESGDHRPGRKAGALVVLDAGRLVAYLERGGRTALTWPGEEGAAVRAADGLADLVRAGRVAALTVERVNGEAALGSQDAFVAALLAAGFHQTPRGVRLRR
ncbi:DEAD/DEAH box helicase [Propioniciclava coleopterorum]|uniref:DEAD/DEAH box helicase n=1 Tax=Propioniciclava coleopterorum TaxID=2714937 RepID=A0A6G7Y5T7_9ACTN|nr:DEAD/DEAH box helicase [Propioniciclava coleopterorum]QIK72079.1 DEAD/DEAH box helicase [Propioniciclava coleopterorum]